MGVILLVGLITFILGVSIMAGIGTRVASIFHKPKRAWAIGGALLGAILVIIGWWWFLFEYDPILARDSRVYEASREAYSLYNIGVEYDKKGQYDQALDYYNQALDIHREIGNETGNRYGEGITLYSIGGVYEKIGQYDQALEYYKQTLLIRREMGNRAGERQVLNAIENLPSD